MDFYLVFIFLLGNVVFLSIIFALKLIVDGFKHRREEKYWEEVLKRIHDLMEK